MADKNTDSEKKTYNDQDIANAIANAKTASDVKAVKTAADTKLASDAKAASESHHDHIYNLSNPISAIFNMQNLIFVLWFLGIYLIAYLGLGLLFNKGGDVSSFQLKLSRTLDIIFLLLMLVVLVSFYFSNNYQKQKQIIGDVVTNTSSFIDDPYSIIITIIFLFAFYTITYLFRLPMTNDVKPIFISFIENIAWLFFVIIAFFDFFKYVLGVSMDDILEKLKFWDYPITDNSHNIIDNSHNVIDNSHNVIDSSKQFLLKPFSLTQPVQKDEVFNVSNNLYTYDDAQSICTAYGAKLANYDQIEETYQKGGEWCNYGWSDGQMIFFPTQKSTWQELQKNEKHKNDCGRPGINGGHIANPYVKFGVNCYGKKPKPTADDLARLTAKQQVVYPKSQADIELDEKTKYWKDNASKLLQLNSYNNKVWSEY